MTVSVKFFLTLGISTLLIGTFAHLFFSTLPSFFYQILFFLFLTTSALFYFLIKSIKERTVFFVQFYLLTMAMKLMAYAAFMIFVISHDRTGATLNVVFFLLVYFVFTALEIGFLYRKMNS